MRNKSAFLTRTTIILVSGLAFGQAGAQTLRHDLGAAPSLGGGFDTRHGVPSATSCVSGTVAQTATGVQSFSWDYNLFESASDYFSSVGGSYALKGGGLFWSANSAGSFLRSKNSSAYELFVEIRSELISSSETMTQATLTTAAAGLSASAFERSCGTDFVSSVQRGGYFTALVSISASSQADHSDLKLKLQATVANHAGKADFAMQMSQVISSRKVRVHLTQRGGTMPAGSLIDFAGVMTAADNWKQTVSGAPEIVSFDVSSYPSGSTLPSLTLRRLREYSVKALEYEEILRRLEMERDVLDPLAASTEFRSGACDETHERDLIDAEITRFEDAIADIEQRAHTCQSTDACDRPPSVRRGYHVPASCRIGCRLPITAKNLVHGQPVTRTMSCDMRDPDAKAAVTMSVTAQYNAWCAASNAGNAPHQPLKLRADAGGRTTYATSGGNPPPSLTHQDAWNQVADSDGTASTTVSIWNEVSPASGVSGQSCAIDVDGHVEFRR